MKAYCILKTGGNKGELNELISEIKLTRPTEAIITKYMVKIYNEMGMFTDTTNLLEFVVSVHAEEEDL